MEDKIKISKWMDWYWNKGGKEKVQAKRYINEYNRLKAKEQWQQKKS